MAKIALFVLLLCLAPAQASERFYCNSKALTSAERSHHQELTRRLLAAVVERMELPNGYGFRLPADRLPLAAEWVGLESRCCPFFDFELRMGRDSGPLWLRLTGSDGVKPFIKAEIQ